MSIIRDISLAEQGRQRIAWVKNNMPLLNELENRYIKEQPFKGIKITVCVHFEAKTAYLCKVLAAGGAQLRCTGSNPLSTKDEITAALVADGLEVFGWFNATDDEYKEHLNASLDFGPNLLLDDGGDLLDLLHGERKDISRNVWGGTEETTTGVVRIKARAKAGNLLFPMMIVNDANSKHLFDNRYGTGQSSWDGFMRATNLQVSGKTAVIAGYGWCGRGIAQIAKGLGAHVIVTEIDPFKALEATMDGFRVMKMAEAAKFGDIFITATGNINVIRREHFESMKDGVLLCNGGHFDVEIDKKALNELSTDKIRRRDFVEGYRLKNGNTVNLISEGRLINVTAGDGHPAEIMDMSFAMQALALEYLAKHAREMQPGCYEVPAELDEQVGWMKLKALGCEIDVLDEQQKTYLESW